MMNKIENIAKYFDRTFGGNRLIFCLFVTVMFMPIMFCKVIKDISLWKQNMNGDHMKENKP